MSETHYTSASMLRVRVLCMVTALAALTAPGATADGDPFAKFWAAKSPAEAAKAVDAVVASRISFPDAVKRLKAGRAYAPQPTGIVKLSRRSDNGVEHPFAVNVPSTYDPAKRYAVRFQLHGGVMGRDDNQPRGTGDIGALAGAEQIYVLPTAWRAAPWWSDDQIDNLDAIVDALKRTYNVDENHVVVSGVSDGGTGAYYVAMRETTPFASFLPLNGFLLVLAAPDIDNGDIFPNNLRNKPIFAVNGERDPLYPTSKVDPYIAHLKQSGVVVDYHPQPGAGHNTAWWPEVKDTFEKFAADHPRDPYPDALTWETADLRHNRAHWLVIDRLSESAPGVDDLADVNLYRAPEVEEFGLRTAGPLASRVLGGTNAERIGLKSGDYILAINGQPLSLDTDVADVLHGLQRGATVTFHVGRGGTPIDLKGTYQPTRQAPPPRQLFARTGPSGRVDLKRAGNTIEATTRGVAAFTLLLSPDRFDFTQPIKVVANGRAVFTGRVEPSVATLVKWAARDNDRTMLYGAELHIDLIR